MTIERIVGVNNAGNMAKIIPTGTVAYIMTATPTANYVVGAKGIDKNIPNPMAFASRNVVDALYGAKSFDTKAPDIKLIQADVNSALKIAARINGNPGKANLTAAQTALAQAAAAKNTADKNAAMAAAKTALQAAQKEYTTLGYTEKTLKSGNINIVGGENSTKIVL